MTDEGLELELEITELGIKEDMQGYTCDTPVFV